MLNQTDILKENYRRLKEIKCPYNPYTGEGSNSIERIKVQIEGAPLPIMYLPKDFAKTGFLESLKDLGIDGYIKFILGVGPTNELRDELWANFCKERIKYDFEYWAVSLATISIKGKGRDDKFTLNRAQRYYLKKLEELRLAGVPIDIILLKARQWGGSTLTQLYMLWIQLVHRKNWNSVICGAVEAQAKTVRGMLTKALDHYELWATDGLALTTHPFEGSQKTRIIDYSKSIYSVGSAERPESLRSQDISMAHLTEVGIWGETSKKKPEDLVQSIFGSILSGPYTLKVLESTAKGVGNYFHRTWIEAVEGKNNFTPVFIPWFMIDIYSKPINQKDYPSFIASLTEYECWLFELGATLEAINWYRDKSKEITDRWRMCSEFPSTAEEAFQSTGRRVFPINYVSNIKSTCIDPICYGEFVGNSDKGKEAFEGLHFEKIIPTKKNPEDVLWIWGMPDKTIECRDRYVVSIDVGGVSSTSDPSEIKVADRISMLEGGVPEIVAEWHGHIDHDLLIWKGAQIAKAYNDALLVIESNTLETDGTEGDNFEYILDEIRSYYDNLYYRTSPEQIKQGMPTRYGFHTNVHTKPTVINFLKAAMRDNLYLERSLPTILEYNLFEIKSNGKEMGAVEGNHDDRVMATAILIYICYKWAPPRIIVKMKFKTKNRNVSEAVI